MNNSDKGPYCIIFESSFTGHRSSYIKYLMEHISAKEHLHHKYLFVLDVGMEKLLGPSATSKVYKIRYYKFPKEAKYYVKRTFKEWKMIQNIFSDFPGLREFIFMEVDTYLILLLSRPFSKLSLNVKGILFQPYIHFKGISSSPTFALRKIWKNKILQRVAISRNPNLKRLFVLNDKKGVLLLNDALKPIFKNLPDPIAKESVKVEESFEENIISKYKLNSGKKNLLVFGSIDDRKNLLRILEALIQLPEKWREQINLVIAGKLLDSVRKDYLEAIARTQKFISINFNDSFVKEKEREVVFKYANLVLIPYVRFYSASSVVGHAIAHKKNLIGPNKGLLARIIEENNLGKVVNPESIIELMSAISEMLENPGSITYNNEELLDEYDPENFSNILLNS